jgi:hypothetical protein
MVDQAARTRKRGEGACFDAPPHLKGVAFLAGRAKPAA